MIAIAMVLCVDCGAPLSDVPHPEPRSSARAAVREDPGPQASLPSAAPSASPVSSAERSGFFPPWTPESDHLDQIHVIDPVNREPTVGSPSGRNSGRGMADLGSAGLGDGTGGWRAPSVVASHTSTGGEIVDGASVVRGLVPRLKRCVRLGQEHDPTLFGSVHLDLDVGADGDVKSVHFDDVADSVSNQGLLESLRACLRARVETAHFAKPVALPAHLVVTVTFAPS